jgi:hypothetical protein
MILMILQTLPNVPIIIIIIDKIASDAWLKSGELFPETTGFMIAIQDHVISTNNNNNNNKVCFEGSEHY